MTQEIRPIQVFSFQRSVQVALKQDEIDFDLDKILPYPMFKRSPEYIINQCTRITSEIYSNVYSFYEFKLVYLYLLLFNKNVDLKNINLKNIKKIRKLFSNNQLENDRELILKLKGEIDYDDISFFFRFNVNDVTYLYEFMEKELISPMFWLRYADDKYFKNNEFIENEKHQHFRNVMKLLKRVILNNN